MLSTGEAFSVYSFMCSFIHLLWRSVQREEKSAPNNWRTKERTKERIHVIENKAELSNTRLDLVPLSSRPSQYLPNCQHYQWMGIVVILWLEFKKIWSEVFFFFPFTVDLMSIMSFKVKQQLACSYQNETSVKASSCHLQAEAGLIRSDNWGSQTRPPAERWAQRSCFLFAATVQPSQTTGGGLLSPLRSFGTNGPVRTTSSAVLHHLKVNAQFSSRAKQTSVLQCRMRKRKADDSAQMPLRVPTHNR